MFDVKFLLSEKIYLLEVDENGCHRRASWVSVIKNTLKNVDLFEKLPNKVLRCGTLGTNILKCKFWIRGIEPTWFIFFEVLRIPQVWDASMWTISVGYARKSTENKRCYKGRIFSLFDSVGETSHTFSARGISPFLLATGMPGRI